LARPVFGHALPHLCPGREMQEAIPDVIGGAQILTGSRRGLPRGGGADVIDEMGMGHGAAT